MAVDRARREDERLGDRLVALAVGHELCHLAFPRAQGQERIVVAVPVVVTLVVPAVGSLERERHRLVDRDRFVLREQPLEPRVAETGSRPIDRVLRVRAQLRSVAHLDPERCPDGARGALETGRQLERRPCGRDPRQQLE